MTSSRTTLRLFVVAASMIGLGPGCDSSTQIPLANVPDPPKDFGKPVTTPRTPPGGSPENVRDYGIKR